MQCRLFVIPDPFWMTTGDSDVESESPFLLVHWEGVFAVRVLELNRGKS